MVTILRGTPVQDPYSGQETGLDWTNPERIESPELFVLQDTSSSESDGIQTTTTDAWRLYVPEGAIAPTARDRIEYDGERWTLAGNPLRERNPFTGWAPYASVRIVREEGTLS